MVCQFHFSIQSLLNVLGLPLPDGGCKMQVNGCYFA
jgi:hypothetical protein